MTASVVKQTILGESASIRELHDRISKVAASDLPVLIQGPSGSGKELVATALHLASGRSGLMVAFNVCAITDTMFEAQLFGHARGAFTGATSDAPGFLVEANRGTLFLDEISGLAPQLQMKVLRAVETGQFRPVGARQDRRSDFRVVAATNEVLTDLVASGQFRLDLFQRLSGIVLHVPALRERPEDIPLLARHFLQSTSAERGAARELTVGATHILQKHTWPGNVRELKHVLAAAALLSSASVLTADAVSAAIETSQRAHPVTGQTYERRKLIELLESVGGDTERAALLLGVNRSTVYRRAWRLGIDPAAYRSPSGKRESTPSDPSLRVLR